MAQKLGNLLINAGLINEQQLEKALKQQREQGNKKLGTILVELGYISEEKLVEFLAQQYKVQSIKLKDAVIDPSLNTLISTTQAKKYNIFPVKREGRNLYIAMSNPSDVFILEDLKFSTGYNIIPLVAADSEIAEYIDKYFESEDISDDIMEDYDLEEDIEVLEEEDEERELDDSVTELTADVESGPVVKMVNNLITKAVEWQASDIHIEPYDRDLRIRYKIDGVLRPLDPKQTPPWKYKKTIVSRIKILSGMKLQEQRLPQDGRIKVKVNGKPIDIRVATVPTMYGEKVALRILDREKIEFKFDKLGLDQDMEKQMLKAIKTPVGIVLITGPSGCGKTTTLYTCIEAINSPEINITTAEDPIEFSIVGVNQLQVNENVNLTFASALRAYLRQDPNVIMVGEIRDKETAEIAIRAALTGHLVLSSVHTNSAPGTITRLINMGVEPFLIASTVNFIVSQRLVRKICDNCKVEDNRTPEELKEIGIDPEEFDHVTIYKGAGCEKCGGTGYRGQVGIFETLELNTDIRKGVLKRLSTDELSAIAKGNGLITLREAALRKLKAGIVDVLEVVKETTLR